MFKHKGHHRTFYHNLGIAAVLSFVAGIVNITGFMSVQEMTSNVTGHFVFFTEEINQANYIKAASYIAYVAFFLLGAFASNFLTELIARKKHTSIYTAPALFEVFILSILAFTGTNLIAIHPNLLAFSLLFCMGFQNSLVTSISNSVVRTTHLTGLFTDLGIELSQWFFYTKKKHRLKLKKSIQLHLTIIIFFIIGALSGGYVYPKIELLSLLLPAALLLFFLAFDYIRMKISFSSIT